MQADIPNCFATPPVPASATWGGRRRWRLYEHTAPPYFFPFLSVGAGL